VILAAIADQQVPARTIAPKFTGRFNKGVDYVGDPAQFEREFNDDIAAIAHAVARFGLPGDLKLSVHSGSDKFAIYPIARAPAGTGARVRQDRRHHLAEDIGLGPAVTRSRWPRVYAEASPTPPGRRPTPRHRHRCDPAPAPSVVNTWSAEDYANACVDQSCPGSPARLQLLRRLLRRPRWARAIQHGAGLRGAWRAITTNLDRHIRPLWLNS
jgi:hypothetical protein